MARKKTTKKRTTRKKTTHRATARRTTRKTTRKKTAARPSSKIPSTDRPRTKAEVFRIVAENTDLSRQQIAQVFDVVGDMIQKDLGTRGPGVFNLAGLMKVVVQKKPATKARKGINPFTGEEMMFKAKPARKVVKVRPLKALKEMV